MMKDTDKKKNMGGTVAAHTESNSASAGLSRLIGLYANMLEAAPDQFLFHFYVLDARTDEAYCVISPNAFLRPDQGKDGFSMYTLDANLEDWERERLEASDVVKCFTHEQCTLKIPDNWDGKGWWHVCDFGHDVARATAVVKAYLEEVYGIDPKETRMMMQYFYHKKSGRLAEVRTVYDAAGNIIESTEC